MIFEKTEIDKNVIKCDKIDKIKKIKIKIKTPTN